MVTPSSEEFNRLSNQGRPIPVSIDILADMETPLSVYWKLSHDAIHSFLLESVTGGEQLARYSIIGFKPKQVLRSKDRQVRILTPNNVVTETIADGEDPLHALKRHMPAAPIEMEGLPKFIGGAVGCLAYDFVRFLERIPEIALDDLQFDDLAMMICDRVVVFDHAKNLIRVIVLADPTAAGYEQAIGQIEIVRNRLAEPVPPLPSAQSAPEPVSSNVSREQYEGMVRSMVHGLIQGEGVQMVPSQRFSTPCHVHPLSIYRCLRSLNPSPYMFLLRFDDFDVVGASPELLVGLTERTARVRPIAGTRWRGKTEAEDLALERDLLADEKERAEHIMLVDLGRNDLGRIADYGSVKVNELMVIERYSHVMHIVSDVEAKLRSPMDSFDLVRATFPAGTVSGAPKVRAMQTIEKLEPTRRGLYAGAVGYFSADGDCDLAIALRTIFIKNGTAYVQAGAGIVVDSDPGKEFEETCNKASACLKAIELAHTGERFA